MIGLCKKPNIIYNIIITSRASGSLIRIGYWFISFLT